MRSARLRSADEIEGSADADEGGPGERVEAARREDLLLRRAEREEADTGAGTADARDRSRYRWRKRRPLPLR